MMTPGSTPASARISPHGSTIRRVAVGLATVLVLAALRGGDDVAAGLDGAGAEKDVPVRLAGDAGEGGGDGDDLRAADRELAVEVGEADIVADRHAELAGGKTGDDGFGAGGDSCRTRDRRCRR